MTELDANKKKQKKNCKTRKNLLSIRVTKINNNPHSNK